MPDGPVPAIAAGSRWKAPIARLIAADRARGYTNRTTLGARFRRDLDAIYERERILRSAATRPAWANGYCYYPRGRNKIAGWDVDI